MGRGKSKVTRREFDALEPKLRREMEAWWEDESASVTATPSSPIFGGLPAIDSKTVAKSSSVVRRLIGMGIDPKSIKKGGYSSIKAMLDDIIPKLRAACPENKSATAA